MRSEQTEALAALYDQHAAAVFRFVYRRCGDREQAEDITQDAFMTAIRTAEDSSVVSVGWLMTVARNRLIDIVRREARFESKLALIGSRADRDDEGEIVAEGMQVWDALTSLKVEYRLVLVLHYMDGVPIAELADELGRSVEAVKHLVKRARRNLVRELERLDA